MKLSELASKLKEMVDLQNKLDDEFNALERMHKSNTEAKEGSIQYTELALELQQVKIDHLTKKIENLDNTVTIATAYKFTDEIPF